MAFDCMLDTPSASSLILQAAALVMVSTRGSGTGQLSLLLVQHLSVAAAHQRAGAVFVMLCLCVSI